MQKIAASKYLGADWETAILNPSDDLFANLETDYTGIQKTIADNEERIEKYEDEIDHLEELKEAFAEAAKEYEYQQYEMKLATFFGSDYEYQLLNNSSMWRQQFVTEYSAICAEIEALEERIKTANDTTTSAATTNAEKTASAYSDAATAVEDSATRIQAAQESIDSGLDGVTEDVVNTAYDKVMEIDTVMSTLTILIGTLKARIEALYSTMQEMDKITLSNVIAAFGGASGSGEETGSKTAPSETGSDEEGSSSGAGLLGAIKAVDEAIGSADNEESLLGKLQKVDDKTLENIIAEFGLGGEDSEGGENSTGLLSAVKAVSNAIVGTDGKDENSLIASLERLGADDTLENVTSVKDSFTDLLDEINLCVKEIETLATSILNLPPVPSSGGSGNGGSIDTNAKGGIITKNSAGDFDYIAQAVGEDHTIAVQEGEAIIPKSSVEENPALVQSLIDGNGLKPIDTKGIVIGADGRTLIPYNPFPNIDFTKLISPVLPDRLPFAKFAQNNIPNNMVNNNQKAVTVSIGDIHIHEVQNVDDFAKDMKRRINGIVTQEMGRR